MVETSTTSGTSTFSIPSPPQEIFKYRGNIHTPQAAVMNQEQSMFVLQGVNIPPTGGIFAHFEGVPYPNKGFPFPEAIYANNFCKKILKGLIAVIAQKDNIKELIAFVLSRKKIRIRKISRFISQYQDIAFYILQPFYLKDIHCGIFTRELRKFITTFLTEYGIDANLSERFSETISTLFEYDNAYRLRVEDIFSETTKEKILENPRKELVFLLNVLAKREPTFGKQSKDAIDGKVIEQEEGTTYNRFEQIGRLFSLAFFMPSFRRAFKKAMVECDFKNLQLDDADRYHILLWADYNFLGKTIEERLQMYNKIHQATGFPRRITYKPNA